MATLAPLLPGLPDLAPRRPGRRRCASTLEHGWKVVPVVMQTPTAEFCDFLALWYAHVRKDGEHAALWGEVGLSPSRFVATFAAVPLIIVHHDQLPWKQA